MILYDRKYPIEMSLYHNNLTIFLIFFQLKV